MIPAGYVHGFAIAVAILGIMGLSQSGLSDFSLVVNNETVSPPYLSSNFAWSRNILGGLLFGMFGIGMTLVSDCGNKTLLRAGERQY